MSAQRGQPQRRRPQSTQDGSPRAASRQKSAAAGAALEKGPDPSEFEAAFSIGDDGSAAPSRVATPRPEEDVKEAPSVTEETKGEIASREDADGTPQDTNGAASPQPQSTELPTEVRTRLRKLDRLESKYGELLKAYRTAHARVQTIEPFEATLREYTPLTGINDPAAFVEYLGQVSAKGDMILDEFKKVSAERDDFKKQAEQSEETASQLRTQLAELKQGTDTKADVETLDVSEKPGQPELSLLPAPAVTATNDPTSPKGSIKSPASTSSRIQSFSLFSPRSKPMSTPKDTSEDLFSYDSEVPRLEQELQTSQTQVEQLRSQMEKLKGDLTVARESTEGMVTSLESATRELHELRDAKDKFDEERSGLEARINQMEAAQSSQPLEVDAKDELEQLRTQTATLSKEVEDLEHKIERLEESKSTLESQLEESQAESRILNEKLEQKDATVKDLENSLAMAVAAAREQDQQLKDGESYEKKLNTMQGIMTTLRSQLSSAEKTVQDLRDEIKSSEEKFEARASSRVFGFLDDRDSQDFESLKTRDDVIGYLAANFGLRRSASDAAVSVSNPTSTAVSEAGTSQASKKKNKKKKKGKPGQTSTDTRSEGPVKVSENLAEIEEEEPKAPPTESSDASKLREDIASLNKEIETRDSRIERLSTILKDQEALQEEIETLRDDLLHQGEEHVEARDRLKTAEAERTALREKVEKLEDELLDLQKSMSSKVGDDESRQKTRQELEESRLTTISLQTDLTAAEQLAASRFKDLTELREVLTKAQPELRALRSEVAELKTAKEDLKNKEGELKRLESRHDDLKSEMKGLGKRLGDKDSEIKELQHKIEQETTTRIRAEQDLSSAQTELKSTETRRMDAVSLSNERANDLKKSRDDNSKLKAQLANLEERLTTHEREVSELREEISLKTALHSSSQQLVHSLRDQTHELNTQARESSARAENLEEELAEAQRMLTERTREGQTMRMLLNQSETGTETRVREMKERMDAAIEERDRIEDEASVGNRRMMRELDDAKSKARDAQRQLKILEDERDEMDIRQRDSKRRLNDLEQASERATKEVEDVRAAMATLREALNESERQVHDMETQKGELRRIGDEAKERVEKLTKANKNLTEELKALQAGTRQGPRPGHGSGVQSSRTSIDSARSPAPVARDKDRERDKPTGSGGREAPNAHAGLSQGTVDYVYLKNVLLQFLEQKDKAHQRQLIPVLGMLLHFDR